MRKLIYILLLGISFLCSSCEFEEDQMGFPKTIVFPKEGGTQVITGDNFEHPFGLTYLLIGEGSDRFPPQKVDSSGIEVSHKWLTVKSQGRQRQLIITAEPLEEGSYRTLFIEACFDPKYATIKVKQHNR